MKIAGKKGLVSGISSDHCRNRTYGTAIKSCFDATGMVTGGFSGIAIIIKLWTKGLMEMVSRWVTNLC